MTAVSALDTLQAKLRRLVRDKPLAQPSGEVSSIAASGIGITGLSCFLSLGDMVRIGELPGLMAEIIRLDRNCAWARCFQQGEVVRLGQKVMACQRFTISPCEGWKGRMVDALARPIDGGGPIAQGLEELSVDAIPPPSLQRQSINQPITTGIRAIDLFTPICQGQRLGIFAGSGVGKSTLLSMLGAAQAFESIVVVLVGERGREVREFAEAVMRAHAARLVSVVATSDETAMMRKLAPRTGLRIAEYFRDQGQNVLLIMDSVTRYAHACRDVALAAGEAPVARGYPPSVFSELPQLLERAGAGVVQGGFITGVFSVLVDGDDHNDPVADAIRGTLDGHIVLSRRIAEQGRYPAIDIPASISRLSHLCWSSEQRQAITYLTNLVNRYEGARDLLAMGAYQPGGDPELDTSIAVVPKLYKILQQTPQSPPTADSFAEIAALLPGNQSRLMQGKVVEAH